MSDEQLDAFRSAIDWAGAIRRKEVSPVEVAELYLDRIDRLDPQLNAFTFRADDEVRAAAHRAADLVASTPADELPPFLGVPLPIKDLNNVEGWPTSYGSRGGSDEPVAADELMVARCREAGFVLLGKTNTPEFGTISYTENERFGATRNPWNPNHTPGGSSGGAGAAVASGMAPLAQASDGGGSIRIPASCNGLVGLKPSRNRVPAEVNAIEGFATNGVVSRTVADTAAVLDVVGQPDPLGWYNAPPSARPFAQLAAEPVGHLRVGVSAAPFLPIEIDPEVLAAHATIADLMSDLGHEVVPIELSVPDPELFAASFTAVWNTGSGGLPIDPTQMEPLNRALRDEAKALDSLAYVEAVYTTQLLARSIVASIGTEVDVLLTPTMACLPPLVGSVWEGADVDPSVALLNCYPMAAFTAVWNVTGLPAISLPLAQSASGLPIGIQFVAGPWNDALLLQLGTQLEAAAPWADRRPTVS